MELMNMFIAKRTGKTNLFLNKMSTFSEGAKAQQAKILYDDKLLLATLSTSKVDTEELSRKMFQRCIISNDMKNLFTSLDYSRVDHQLQVRYLLRLVSEKVKEDESVWGKFLNLLDSMGEKQLYNHFKENCTTKDTPSVQKGTCLDIPLNKKDMNWLTKILVPVSHKWELLGIALSLPTHELENCRRLDNKISLSLVLSCWLSGCTSKIPEATQRKLAQALRSELEQEGQAALDVEEKLLQVREIRENSLQHVSCMSSLLTIVNQSDQVDVADSKSTLLQILASPSESLKYQWKKDGHPLANDCTYSGVHNDILVVSHATQGTEGEYTCCVSSCEREVCSNKITLTVLYTPAKKRLLNLYSTHKEVPPDSWPPAGTKMFINLVLFKSGYENYYNDQSAITNVSFDKREDIDYKQIFCKYEKRKLIFIEGRPGSGKTTLVHKLVKDWTINNALSEANLVFLVTLRNLNHCIKEDTLPGVLSLFYHTDLQLKSVVSNIENADGEGVCFIFDGLDEYKPQDRQKSVIYKLLDKTYLPLAIIIVASRPAAIDTLRQDAITHRIEVFGFTRENILEYIDEYPFKSSSTDSKNITYSANLKDYLHSHPKLLDMCYLPVHAAMICFLYNHKKGSLPCTQTKIYEECTQSMILRHLKRYKPYIKIRSLESLKGDSKISFNNLCLLAFTMTVDSKQVVTQDEIDMQLSEGASSEDASSDDGWPLGLVTVNKIVQLYGIDDTYSFLHLTFQEFMTAYYIATLDYKERMEKITNTELCKSMSTTVWKFYCGLVKLKDQNEIDVLFDTLRIIKDDDITFMHYAFESQQQLFCDEVIKKLNGCISLFIPLKPSDISALSYVICTTSQPVTALNLNLCDNTRILQQICGKDFGKLERITVGRCSDAGLLALSILFKSCTSLSDAFLNFEWVNLTCMEVKYVAGAFKYLTRLKTLDMCISSPTGIMTLLSGLQHCTDTKVSLGLICFDKREFLELESELKGFGNVNVHEITFLNCVLCPEGAAHFANGLHYCSQIEKLNIIVTDVEEVSTCAIIASAITSCKKLKSLDISCDDAIALTDTLHQLHNLQVLKVTNYGMKLSDTIQLASKLHSLCRLKILDLSRNTIGQAGAVSLVGKLHSLPFLEKLDFSVNSIGPAGAVNLANELHHLPCLEELDLSENNIGPVGTVSLANELHHLPCLEELDLSANNIGPVGTVSLANELHHLTKLKKINLGRNGVDLDSAIAMIIAANRCQCLHTCNMNLHSSTTYSPGIHVNGIVSSQDETAVASLVAAVQHDTQDKELHLDVYKTLKVPSKKSTKHQKRI